MSEPLSRTGVVHMGQPCPNCGGCEYLCADCGEDERRTECCDHAMEIARERDRLRGMLDAARTALEPFAIASTRPVLYAPHALGGPSPDDWPDDAVVELLTNAGDVRRVRAVCAQLREEE